MYIGVISKMAGVQVSGSNGMGDLTDICPSVQMLHVVRWFAR